MSRKSAMRQAQKSAEKKRQRINKNQMKWMIIAALAMVLIVGGCMVAAYTQRAERQSSDLTGTYYVQMDVKDYGSITAELYADVAPITVENFLNLVDSKFYDGLTFHRIIDGFMIQGGDPLGNGTGGSENKIKGEFSQNGVENNLKHTRGVLSMARSQAMDSASSQFFIMHQDAPHLDGGYAAFGKVLSGMEIVDAICRNTPVTDYNGTVLKANQPVMERVVRIDKPAE